MKDLPVMGTIPEELPQHDTIVTERPDVNNNELRQTEFYIIIGSFKNLSEAQQLVGTMRKNSTMDIIVLPPTTEGNYRVSYGRYSTYDEASLSIKAIRANIKPDAWIFSAVKMP
jgi:hypothetical protein